MIRKGESWGTPIELDGSEPVVDGDAQLALLLSDAMSGGGSGPTVLLTGGDLHRCLGGVAALVPHALPVDLLEVSVNGQRYWAVGHVIARSPLWSGEFLVVMNGSHLGEWNLGPKAHPNDGLVDVTIGSLGPADRLAARRRAHTGSHLPHPGLRTSRVREITWNSRRPVGVYVDGTKVGRSTAVSVVVHPDAGAVVIR